VARFTHNGESNFVVWAYFDGGKDLLVNTIGAYEGTRPVVGDELVLDIDADGAWTVEIAPIGWAADAAFSGRGDAVSGVFDPPSTGPWEFWHNGTSNFVVWLHCAGGSNLVQNEIGPVSGSGIVAFEEGPCCWEVEADGDWSLKPR